VVLTAVGLLTHRSSQRGRAGSAQADRSRSTSTAPDAFVAAMERLGHQSRQRRPGRLRELLFATHPSLEARIATGRAAGARLAAAP
jgi:Zn-dependent protease with chaperone function